MTGMIDHFGTALAGGILIGLASALILLLSGRITGVSGIIGSMTKPQKGDFAWRVAFLLSLVGGGYLLRLWLPKSFPLDTKLGFPTVIVAGFLVGYGSRLGGGCTSGHGVCGLGRASPRGITATIVFMAIAMLTVALTRGALV